MSEILSGEDLAAALVAELGPTLTEGPATADTPDQPRDDAGRFASPEAPVESVEASTEDTTTEAPAQDTADEVDESQDIEIELTPELEAYLEKYDGDLGKALQASADAQSLIGRQGDELGQARRELEALRQQQQQPQQQPSWLPYRNDIDENPQALVMEALERNDPETFTRAIRAWASLGPEESFEATMFMNQFNQYQQQIVEPDYQDTSAPESTVQVEMQKVLAKHPDAGSYATEVAAIQADFPTLREELHYGDPAQQARAYEQLLVIAKGRAVTPDTQKATRRLIVKTQEEVRKAKDDADVVSASNRSAAQAAEANPIQDALDAIFPTPQDLVKHTQTQDGRTVRVIGE